MKLQFSLATLLVCMTVFAVVCAVAALIPVYEKTVLSEITHRMADDGKPVYEMHSWEADSHAPTGWDIARRLAWSAPLGIATTLATLWAIRRLKSRRPTEPPVG